MNTLAVIWMKPLACFSSLSGRNSILDVFVSPNNLSLSSDGDVGKVNIISLGVGHASNATGIVCSSAEISQIFKPINGPEIAPSVVGSVSVDVVNFDRSFSCLHEPNDAVSHKALSPNADTDVAIGSRTPSNFASVLGIPSLAGSFAVFVSVAKFALRPFLPKQMPSDWIVFKHCKQRFLAWQLKIAHAEFLSKAGQMFSSFHLSTQKIGAVQ